MLKDTGSGVRRSWLKPMLCHSLALQSRVCPLVCKAGLTLAPGSADTALAEQRPAMISMTLSCVPGNWTNSLHSFFFFVRFYLSIARERRREGEKKGNIYVWLPLTCPPLGTWPTTQACALTGNPTSNPLVRRLALKTLSHTFQGQITVF